MYPVEILYIKTINNFCNINSFFIFEILYEIKYILTKDFQIKAIYITSSLEKNDDQELELFTIPGNKIGKFKVFLKIRAPDYSSFRMEELTEVNVILLIFLYDNIELIRIGYYMNNEILFENEMDLKNSPKIKSILRKILTDKPRITYFPFFSENIDSK